MVDHKSQLEGLAHNTVFCMLPDQGGDIWLGTGNGITIMSSEGDVKGSIFEEDGLHANAFSRFDNYRAGDGRFWFGQPTGLNVIDPEAVKAMLQEEQRDQHIYLTDLIYYDTEKGEEVHLPKSSLRDPEIKLPAESRNLKLRFALSNYLAPEKNSFMDRLSGLDENWQYLGANHELNLFNLPPGQYRLQIKGSDFRNNWSNQVLEIPIRARAFFYKQLWFTYSSSCSFL